MKAQNEDYPARSVYKLIEIDKKFNFFNTIPQINSLQDGQNTRQVPQAGLRVLDLGAAPGSWSLYVLRRYRNLFLVAADLLPLSRHFDRYGGNDFFFIQGDFTGDPVREELLRRGPYSAIISDAAPGTTGSRTVDTLRSLTLAEEALSYAKNSLAPSGNLVIKIFQGEDTVALLKRLREVFNKTRTYKPAACRSNSFETYLIGLEKRIFGK